jgi:hypothetical protein
VRESDWLANDLMGGYSEKKYFQRRKTPPLLLF